MSIGIIRNLGVGRFLEWGVVDSRGATGSIVVFWDNRVLELVDLEAGVFSISSHFKNCEDGFFWTFIGIYGPTLRRDREWFWGELGAIKGLWSGPWCVAWDFNLIKCPEKHNRGGCLNSDLKIKGLVFWGGGGAFLPGVEGRIINQCQDSIVS